MTELMAQVGLRCRRARVVVDAGARAGAVESLG